MPNTWQISGANALNIAPKIIKIEAEKKPQTDKLRVAAYTRVSSDSADQLNSFAAQNRYYNEKICENENWTLVEIYADEGITGTSAEKREDFQRMMADCRSGFIDQILVKSISRFARNTKDCLQAIRELKTLGVNVHFEREGINTADVSSELITSIYAAFAQKESESISGNMKWSYKRRMESGTFLPSSMAYGYKIVGKKIEIEPESASVVTKIFQWYLSGIGMRKIAERLNSETNEIWYHTTVQYILTNEKYTGDSLWQKSYMTDTLPSVKLRNKGEREQYYAFDTHPALISKEDFERVQKLISTRREMFVKNRNKRPHPLAKMLICGDCGTVFRRKIQHGKAYWCCTKHDNSQVDCPMKPIAESEIYTAFCRLHYKLKHHPEILNQLVANLQAVRNSKMLWSEDIVLLNRKIAEISSQKQTLTFLKEQGLVDSDIFISQNNELTSGLHQAKKEREKLLSAENDQALNQTQELIQAIEESSEFLEEFDSTLFAETVEKIIVESSESIRFQLSNGLKLREKMERTVR